MKWYQRAMPTIKDTMPYVLQAAQSISSLPEVKNVYVWGSFADNIKNDKYNVKDIDILVECNINSGDLLAIDKTYGGAFDIAISSLEDEGFDPDAVAFTKGYLNFGQFNIDQWAMSSDNVLLHWGPITETIEEWKNLRSSAEKEAKSITGLFRKSLCTATEDMREKWKAAYDSVIQDFISGGPVGWYASKDSTDKILDKAIKLV